MKKHIGRVSVGLLVLAAALTTSSANANHGARIQRASEPIEGSYVVTLREGVPNVPAAAIALAHEHGGTLGFTYTRALHGFSVRMNERDADTLAQDMRVLRVEQDGVMRSIATQSNPTYGLDRIDQRALPLNAAYTYNATGAGVRAYIIDTGIRAAHTDFGGRASVGTDKVGDGQNGVDCNGHGTHVAGTVGGTTYGVAKSVTLIGVRVLGCDGSGATSGVIAGIDWVTANRVKPAVANMSLGGGASTSLDNAVSNSINAGVTYAIAAGNGNILGMAQDACGTSPARVAAALTVSATDSTDKKASFANYGTCVDIFAPGVNVTSAWNSSNTATNTISGTSMAAPHVAGAAALYLQGNTTATPSSVGTALTSNATNGVVTSPGTGSPNKLLYTGFITGGGTGNNAPTANFTSSCSGLTCSFTDTSTDSDGSIASRSWNFGDGATSTATNPSRTYAAAGTYTVTLTVTDNAGAPATTSKSVTVTSGGGGDPDPSTPNLTNGVARSDTNGATGTWKYYKIQVPAGKSKLAVSLNGAGATCSLLSCNPDTDLYVRKGSKPTTATYNCAGATSNASESCSINSPAADYYYIGVYVYSSSKTITYTVTATIT